MSPLNTDITADRMPRLDICAIQITRVDSAWPCRITPISIPVTARAALYTMGMPATAVAAVLSAKPMAAKSVLFSMMLS